MNSVEKNGAAFVRLHVTGMHCANCALGVQKYLESMGLQEVFVSQTTEEVAFRSGTPFDLEKAKKGIEKLGYHVVSQPGKKEKKPFLSTVKAKFYFCLFFTVPLFFSMFLPWHFLHHPYVQLALCLPVLTVGGFHFLRSGFYSLKAGVPNMDVLITLGSFSAFIYSLLGTLGSWGPDYQFYETTAVIITVVLLGNLLEENAVKKTSNAIQELGKLQKNKARKILADPATGKEEIQEIDSEEIVPGDIILVNAGDSIPADGIVLSGSGAANESMMTGESLPIEKREGDKGICGTVLVAGNIRLQTTAIGKETILAQIIDLISKAQHAKPPIQRLADKISAYFIPTVLFVSLVTFGVAHFLLAIPFSAALLQSIAVLTVSCPCAMGLATPTAVMVGIGLAAKHGILIKRADIMETFDKIQTVVFDKTGTLTTGDLKIQKITTFGIDEEEAKAILGSIEKYSSHPIAVSILKELSGYEGAFEWKEVEEKEGMGLCAHDPENNLYLVGSSRISPFPLDDPNHDVYLFKNERLLAYLDIQDEIKEEAKIVLPWLKKNKIKTILLSGDKKAKCAHVSEVLGLDEYYAEQLPSQKLAIIEDLAKREIIAMVGDGINDAPALARATVGISLSNASRVAIESAQITLLGGNLLSLPLAFEINHHTFRAIQQNLFWAFFYNIIAIPFAALGYLSPMLASFAMACSDVFVVGNSLLLKRRKIGDNLRNALIMRVK